MSDKTTKEVDLKVSASGAEKVPGLFARIGHEIHEMNQAARGGAFHGIETILKGAGIAAAVKFTAESVRAGAQAWKEYREGLLTVPEAIDKAINAIPLLGSINEAGSAIIEAIHAKPKMTEWQKAAIVKKGAIEGANADRAYSEWEKSMEELYRNSDPLHERLRQQKAAANRLLNVEPYKPGVDAAGQHFFRDAGQNMEEAAKRTAEELRRAEGSFMRQIRTGIEGFVSYGWREAAFSSRKAVREAVNAANDRQDEIDLDAWRAGAETRKNAEESFASDYELKIKGRKEDLMKIAADDRVPDELRKKALGQAGMIGGIIPGGYSPNVQGNLLTGAHARSGEAHGGSDQKIEKNTEKTAKGVGDATSYLKDIADALKQRPSIIIGIGL